MDHAYFRLLSRALPVEILDCIFQELDPHHLPPLLRANHDFHTIGTRILYRIIPEMPISRCIHCLKALCRSPTNAALVRKLSIDWSQHRVVSNLFRLLRDALTHLTSIRHLSVELSPHDNHYGLAWVLAGVCTPLKTLGTSIRCDVQLAEVLETQPALVELCLRGFQTKQGFSLSDGAMPLLRSFRTVHAGPSVISEVVRGRPVEGVSLSMFLEDGCQPLDSLRLSTRPIKRLTIMSLDSTLAPTVLLPEIAKRLPELEALHVVVLMALFDTRTLQDSGPCLSKFADLRYLTFMAAGSASIEDEGEIARTWSKACPTLRTIILPKGKVWFERDGKWTCCG
ncbi:hypothetical protein LXA43DRAFT_974021 [Ganoderma leucocontextum]|nr:hypothetical protein LXA43DRAFT_974021 [Ganoderma leucocontextum]